MSESTGSDPSATQRRFNGLAIASLVVAVFLVGGLGLGIVLGIMALRQIGRSGQRGRRAALAGIVLSSLWTVGIVAVAVTGTESDDGSRALRETPTPTPAPTAADFELPVNLLDVGTCLKEPGRAPARIKSLGSTSCTKPHKGEVIAGFQSSHEEWPGLKGVRDEATRRCTPTLESVGMSILRKRQVSFVFVYPPEEYWSEEQRKIVCIARTERPFRGKMWSD